MNMHRQNKTLTYAAVLIAGILCWKGYDANQILTTKYANQVDAREKLERYIESYKALLPARDRWNEVYKNAKSIRSIHDAYKAINIESVGLYGLPDKMAIQKVARVQSAGVDLGLVKICPRAGNTSGFMVGAPTTALMIEGVEKLAQRRDIELETISITQATGKIEAVLGLCLLLRDDA